MEEEQRRKIVRCHNNVSKLFYKSRSSLCEDDVVQAYVEQLKAMTIRQLSEPNRHLSVTSPYFFYSLKVMLLLFYCGAIGGLV